MSSRWIYLLGQALLVAAGAVWLVFIIAAVIYRSKETAVLGCLIALGLSLLSMSLIPLYSRAWKRETLR